MNSKTKRISRQLLLGTGFMMLSGCSGYSATGGPAPLVKAELTSTKDRLDIQGELLSIAVMPLEASRGARVNQATLSRMDAVLVRSLELHTQLSLINTNENSALQTALNSANEVPQTALAKAVVVGRNTGAQTVLIGSISRFEPDDESSRNKARPSTVAFRLWLVEPVSSKIVWSATYERNEETLSDNLFALGRFFSRGVRYYSTDELAQEGFEAAAVELEKIRNVKK